MAEPTSSLHADELARARQAPHLHQPRLVVSRDVAGERVLDRIADVVNRLIGSMWLFVGITVGDRRLAVRREHRRASTRRPGRCC